MFLGEKKIKELLVDPGFISEKDFSDALDNTKKTGEDLVDYIVEKDLIQEKQLGRLIADDLDIKFADFDQLTINEEAMSLVPEIVARNKKIIIFDKKDNKLKIATNSPDDLEVIHNIEKKTGLDVDVFYITKKQLEIILNKYNESLEVEINKILEKILDEKTAKDKKDELIIDVVDNLLKHAFNNNVSDIHIEPYDNKVVVRFRIDGFLHDVLNFPKEISDSIVTRIKILSKMRIDEHRSAQDGRFDFVAKYAGKEVDVDARVSVLPVTNGENVVIRILSSHTRKFSIENIGLSDRDLKKIKSSIKKPNGMILVTGPTGSGKTTTLYSVLKELNDPSFHISTIEDPVEYDIEGVSQIQVNNRTNLTFSEGLKAIVRQDPDIIMVGEIRDDETANISIDSALTGHLVLSTLHTNDSATTVPRLLDMNIKPFLLASTINVIVAQRLVRKICQNCRASYDLSEEEIKSIESDKEIKQIIENTGANIKKLTTYKGKGCSICGGTGYVGRVGVFEVLEMSDQIKELIQQKVPSNIIKNQSVKEGMTTMLEDGIVKVLNGTTTLDEIIRVVKK